MHKFKTVSIAFGFIALSAFVFACSSGGPTPATSEPTNVPATVAIAALPAPTAATTAAPATGAGTSPATASAPTTSSTSDSNETVTLVVVPEKSEARYRVREQLAGFSLPSDAIGRTQAITGQIVGKTDGTIDSANSKFVVDVRTLRSDQGMRDGFIQRTPLQTSRYPNVTFVPRSAPGLPLLVPESGSASFQLTGDLTIRDVTKPVTWDATCQLESSKTEGKCSAMTSFTFADFNLDQPQVPRVLSIEDTIKLEVDLYLQRVTD